MFTIRPVLAVLLGMVLGCIGPGPSQGVPSATKAVRIFEIQGEGMASPMNGEKVRTTGVVIGTLANGFFVQDPAGDGDGETSDGLFVYRPRSSDIPFLDLGDRVIVEGTVQEYYELTEIVLDVVTVSSSDNPLPSPAEVNPRKDDAVAASEDLEPLEGMRVSVGRARVIGPTKRYASTDEFYVVREEVFATRPFGRLFRDDPEGTGERIGVLTSAGLAPAVKVGDRVIGIVGPLHYTYGDYKVAQQEPLTVLPSSESPPELPEVRSPAFSVATFNVENLFDTNDDPETKDPILTPEQYDRKLTKLARAVRDGLRAPTILAVQEVEHLSVLRDLSAQPELLTFRYEAILVEGPDRRGIDVGMLVRSDRATVVDLDGDGDGGVFSAQSESSLFSRPPLVVEMKIDGVLPLVVIANHFKSKRQGEAATELRRIEQARFVAGLVEDLLDEDPDARVIVLGDLNDVPDSAPLRALTGGGKVRNLVPDEVPKAERYSFIYRGRAEVLDHILITPSLDPWLVRVDIAHLNADFPEPVAEDSTYRRCSDHDPIRAVFGPRSEKGDTSLNGSVTPYDASLILQAVVGSIELTPEQAMLADVNGSGSVGAYDASLILQYTVGMIEGFPRGNEGSESGIDAIQYLRITSKVNPRTFSRK